MPKQNLILALVLLGSLLSLFFLYLSEKSLTNELTQRLIETETKLDASNNDQAILLAEGEKPFTGAEFWFTHPTWNDQTMKVRKLWYRGEEIVERSITLAPFGKFENPVTVISSEYVEIEPYKQKTFDMGLRVNGNTFREVDKLSDSYVTAADLRFVNGCATTETTFNQSSNKVLHLKIDSNEGCTGIFYGDHQLNNLREITKDIKPWK